MSGKDDDPNSNSGDFLDPDPNTIIPDPHPLGKSAYLGYEVNSVGSLFHDRYCRDRSALVKTNSGADKHLPS